MLWVQTLETENLKGVPFATCLTSMQGWQEVMFN